MQLPACCGADARWSARALQGLQLGARDLVLDHVRRILLQAGLAEESVHPEERAVAIYCWQAMGKQEALTHERRKKSAVQLTL